MSFCFLPCANSYSKPSKHSPVVFRLRQEQQRSIAWGDYNNLLIYKTFSSTLSLCAQKWDCSRLSNGFYRMSEAWEKALLLCVYPPSGMGSPLILTAYQVSLWDVYLRTVSLIQKELVHTGPRSVDLCCMHCQNQTAFQWSWRIVTGYHDPKLT